MRKLKLLIALCMVTIAASAEDTYTVTGSVDDIFGKAWSPEVTDNDMVPGDDGIYTKTFENVTIAGGTTIEYKVVKNHSWDESWGFDDKNAQYDVNKTGTYDITFSFNLNGEFSDGHKVYCALTLSNAFTGEGKVYIKNIAANLWWGAGNDWGTHASLLPHADYVTLVKAPEGRYTMDTQVSNGGNNHYFGGEWMDGAASNLNILKSGENYTISFTEGGNFFGSGNETLANGSQNLKLDVDASSEAALWQILTEADMRATLLTATNAAPQDATWLIADHTFGRNNRGQLGNMTQKEGKNGVWKISDDCTNYSLGGGNSNKHCAESYHSKFASIQQTLTDIPNGWYALTAQGFYRQDGSDNENLPQIFFGNKATNIPLKTGSENSMADACASFESGLYKIDPIFVEVTDGTITLGVKNPDNGSLWIIWDNFELSYYGTEAPISVLSDQLQAVIDAARTTVSGLAVPAGVKTTFETTASDYETAKSNYTIAKEFTDAIDAIAAAVDAAKAAIAPTAENAAILVKAEATANLEGLDPTYKAQYSDGLQYNTTQLAACTTAAEIETLNAKLWKAIGTAINTIQLTGDAKLDLTYLLTNPNVDDFYTGQYNVHVDGWYTEQSDGNFQVVPGEGCANADGIHKHAYEYWSEAPKSNNKFTLYQKVNLPEGTYTINCYAFADQPTGGDNRGIYFYANDTQGSLVANNTLTQQEVSFVNDDQQEVKIGLKAIAGNTYRWMGIGYMELYKVPAKSYTVDESVAWDNTIDGAGAVTLNRTIKEGVNTLVLPFSMTQTEVEANFGTDSKVYALKSYDATKELLSFESHDGISANQPCLLKATVAGTSYTLEGRTIVAGTPEAVVTGAKMIGTYAATMNAPQGSYIISGGKIYNVNSDVALKNTRAYIELTGSTARALTFTLDGGETTGIATLENGELNVETGVIYDLSGRVVKNPAKGIYVINGKKIVK